MKLAKIEKIVSAQLAGNPQVMDAIHKAQFYTEQAMNRGAKHSVGDLRKAYGALEDAEYAEANGGLSADRRGVQLAGTDAAADYAQAQKQCQQALANIASKLKAHASKQVRDPKNWGYVGDLGSVLDNLQEASRMLG